MRIAVLTDSNSGITQETAKELGIKVIPMPFFIDGDEYLEDITLSQEKFYEKLLGDCNVSTSQPSSGYVISAWDDLLKDYDKVIYIPMSSGLSKSCETATQLAQADEYKGKVYVVNNQRISVTQRESVMTAIDMANKGYDCEYIVDYLMKNKLNSDIYIMVDTLTYLKKGGRITAAAAKLGGFLKLKPILLIKGEKLDSFRMRNRTVDNAKSIMISTCIEDINGYMKELDGKTDNVEVSIAYSGTDTTNAYKFKEEIEKALNVKVTYVDPLSLSVSCHIGPGALAIAITKKMEY
ncbi:MAG: DegV family protein [Acholeplasmatales bacterium]|nr:DegV family protein [Acholeplasmatales bacterium]